MSAYNAVRFRVKPGRELRIEAVVQGASERSHHVLLIEVEGPDEEPIPYLSRNVRCNRAEATIAVPIALSEEPGVYRATVSDVASGREGRCSWQVRP